MNNPLKIFSPTSTLQEMVDAAKYYNAGTMKMVFRNIHDAPIAAVIVVRGGDGWTQEVLDALKQFEPEECETELEEEEGDRR